ncbi:MAG: cell division protein FtsQ/DivIB [Caulobacteraceae bacterium]|nr:cell division protein FtsQ/DivIB [Caulobacteraceae bacterium]
MPAALRGERRQVARPRGAAGGDRVRRRAAGAAAAGVSKLQAAQRPALPRGAAKLGAALALLLASAALLATGGRGEAIGRTAASLWSASPAVAGPRLAILHLQGASRSAQDEILRAAAVAPGTPLAGIDLDAVRRRVESVGWVNHATVMRLWPDTLVVAVVQRPLMAVWQRGGRLSVVAANGAVMSRADPVHFSALPLVVGDGANIAASAVLTLLERDPALLRETAALVRVDNRRWDLRLRSGCVILLPAEDESAALGRLRAIDPHRRLLVARLARIDLRDPAMIVMRPADAALPPVPSQGV